jgi:hypothetical protein
MPNQKIIRDQLHDALYQSLQSSGHGLKIVPQLIKRAIAEEIWKERLVHQTKKEIPAFSSFRAYIEARPPNGLGATLELCERLIGNDEETLVLFRQITTGKVGRPSKENNDNIIIKSAQGTSRAYTLDRLKRERPDLFDKVKAGKLSANAAAIEAGFRKQTTKFERTLKWAPTFTPTQLRHLRARIDELLGIEPKGKRAA